MSLRRSKINRSVLRLSTARRLAVSAEPAAAAGAASRNPSFTSLSRTLVLNPSTSPTTMRGTNKRNSISQSKHTISRMTTAHTNLIMNEAARAGRLKRFIAIEFDGVIGKRARNTRRPEVFPGRHKSKIERLNHSSRDVCFTSHGVHNGFELLRGKFRIHRQADNLCRDLFGDGQSFT